MSESATFVVEFSYEATTLDYLSPKWYALGEPFASKEEAEAAKDAASQKHYVESSEPMAFQVRTIPSQAQRDEDAAANASYWADRARVAREAEEAVAALKVEFAKGNVVKVVKGRKVPVGTEGTIFWFGESDFGGFRVGFKTVMGEVHYTALSNVEAIPGMVEVGV